PGFPSATHGASREGGQVRGAVKKPPRSNREDLRRSRRRRGCLLRIPARRSAEGAARGCQLAGKPLPADSLDPQATPTWCALGSAGRSGLSVYLGREQDPKLRQ
ncbi:hypothetical protein E2320_005444, partial [Naja naja]